MDQLQEEVAELSRKGDEVNASKRETEGMLEEVKGQLQETQTIQANLEGEVANPANPPSGCYFHPRCEHAVEQCKTDSPKLEEIEPGRWVSCWRAKELDLPGLEATHST